MAELERQQAYKKEIDLQRLLGRAINCTTLRSGVDGPIGWGGDRMIMGRPRSSARSISHTNAARSAQYLPTVLLGARNYPSFLSAEAIVVRTSNLHSHSPSSSSDGAGFLRKVSVPELNHIVASTETAKVCVECSSTGVTPTPVANRTGGVATNRRAEGNKF